MMESKVLSEKIHRLEWIDVAKGIVIILMVLGHALSAENLITKCIFSFHMPFFVLVSGYFYKRYDLKTFIVKNIKGVLLPYTILHFIQYTLYIFILDWNMVETYKKLFYTLITGLSYTNAIPFPKAGNTGVLWFLPMLFCVRCIFYGIMKISKDNNFFAFLMIAFSALLGMFLNSKGYWLPWSIDVALFSVAFYYLGYIFRKYSIFSVLIQKPLYTLLWLGIWLFGVYQGIVLELATRNYSGDLTCILIALAGSVVFCMLAYYLDKIPMVKAVLSWAGQKTIIIMCIHQLEWIFIKYENYGLQQGYKLFLVKITIIFVITIAIDFFYNTMRGIIDNETE